MTKVFSWMISKVGREAIASVLVVLLLVIMVVFKVTHAEDLPASPTGFAQINTQSVSAIYLSWTNISTVVDKYILSRKLTTDTNWEVSTVQNFYIDSPTQNYYPDTSAQPGVNYDYKLVACKSGVGCSLPVYVIGAHLSVNMNVTPPPPTGLTAQYIATEGKVHLTWTNHSTNQDKFNIYRKLSTPSTSDWYQVIQLTVGSANSYVDSGVSPGNYYDYKIEACLSGSGCSLPAYTTTPAFVPGHTTPSAPTDLALAAQPTQTSVALRWTDTATNEDKYNVERRVYSTANWMPLQQLGANAISYYDQQVTAGTTYEYHVMACLSNVGCSESAPVVVSVPGNTTTGGTTPTGGGTSGTNGTTDTSGTSARPTSPTGLFQEQVPGNFIKLGWTDNSTNEDKWNIERKLSTSNNYEPLTQQVGANITSYTDNSVVTGIYYDYRVQACLSGTGCSDYSFLTYAKAFTTAAPTGTTPNTSSGVAAPSGLSQEQIVGNFIKLHWTDNSTNEDKWNIDRKLSTSDTYSSLTQQIGQNITSYTDYLAAVNTSYDYRVQACLSGTGCSGYIYLTSVKVLTTAMPTSQHTATSAASTTTNQASSTLANYIPFAPTNLFQYISTDLSALILRWTDNATNEDKFNVERKVSSSSTFSYLTQLVGSNITSYRDATAVPGVSYDYRVQACLSGNGCSGYAYFSRASTTVRTRTATTATTTNTAVVPPPQQATTSRMVTGAESTTLVNSSIPSAEASTTAAKISDMSTALEARRILIENTKSELIRIVSESVAEIVKNAETAKQIIDTAKIFAMKESLFVKINSSLTNLAVITPADIDALKAEVTRAINDMRAIAGSTATAMPTPVTQINNAIGNLTETIGSSSVNQDAVLLYKDTNKDGISDYDSVHVYNLDPVKPSPVSTYEGKTINAADKILLGFDPTKKDLVKVEVEQPAESAAAVVTTYKVKEVTLTETKNVILKGQALPNSFVTIYIYSTPIMVTVKTDSNGEWQYTMDKELENGEHSVYTATVNNAGNIVAKSQQFAFVKTAEAVTLKDVPVMVATDTSKPSLFAKDNIVLFVMVAVLIALVVLVLVGVSYKKNEDSQIPPIGPMGV